MNDNRNMILAIVLSALVLFGWSVLSDWILPPTSGPQTARVEDGKAVPLPQPQADPTSDGPKALRDRAQVLASTPRVRIETPSLQGSINLKGAQIDDLVLVRQREGIAANSPAVRLLSPAGAAGSYFASFGWVGQGVQAPPADAVWTADSQLLAPGRPVNLRWTNPSGQRFEQSISIDRDYLFTVRQTVSNPTGNSIAVQPYGLVSRAAKSTDPDGWTMHVGPMGVFNGAANYDVNYDDLDEAGGAGKQFSSTGGWLGFTDKYWLTALAPAGNRSMSAALRKSPNGAYQADYSEQPVIVPAGRSVSVETRLFAGAKEVDALNRYEDGGITALSKAIDWGWFEWFMRPIFNLLNWLFAHIGNFGVAIICLTLIVRLILFPVAQKQFKSMGAMRKVQPKLKAIQAKYKDDKPKLQQEMMKLYQQEKINPAAGCLPMLLQIPIFYALYKVLLVAIEMRHQPFALWIRDLSAPDPMTPLNLFGMLPFTPPAMIAIGVLPILLGITMWMQFKLNPAQADPVQQQIFSFMPWVMMFIMAPFAAGLQLYWVTNNILSILQQWWLYKRYNLDAPEPAPATS